MIRKGTWITLAVFAILLGFAIWWAQRPPESPPAESSPTAGPLWQIDTAEVRKLSVEDFLYGESVVVERDPLEVWRLVEPETGRADSARVEEAVSALSSPQPQASLGAVDDPALYGLAEPEKRVSLTMKDGSKYVFTVGRQAPTGAGYYIQLQDEPGVFVLRSYTLSPVFDLLEEIPLPPTEMPEASPAP